MPATLSLTNTPTVMTCPGNSATISAARSTVIARGLRGHRTKPRAVAPCSTACSASVSRVTPHTLTNMVHLARDGPPCAHQIPNRTGGIGIRHEALADQKRAVAGRGEPVELVVRLEAALAHADRVAWQERREAFRRPDV